MTKYLKTKLIIKDALKQFDSNEEKVSEVLFNVYRREMDAIIEVVNKSSISNVSERPKFVKCSVTGLISVNQSGSSIGGGFWEYLYADEVAKLGIDPNTTKNADLVEGGR